MADVIKLDEKVTQEQVKQAKEDLEALTKQLEEGLGSDFLQTFGALLDLPDEQFVMIAPGIMESFKMSVNNPNDKIALTQAFNAAGYKAEDLTSSFIDVTKAVREMEGISEPKKDFIIEFFSVVTNAVNETEGISKRTISVPIELCNENAKIPQYAHESDSGMDVYALDDITIKPGETVLVPTGIKVALPPGYELQVRPKSGRALKTKLRVANTPGTIDQGYRDEVKVIIENVDPPIRSINIEKWDTAESDPAIHFSDIEFGQSYTIGKGEKFAQLVLMEVPKAAFYRVDSVNEIGDNRNGGFGSTGLK